MVIEKPVDSTEFTRIMMSLYPKLLYQLEALIAIVNHK